MANAAVFRELRHFTPSEFRRPDLMDAEFLRWLDLARTTAGVPFIITSDARTAAENAAVGGWERSLHLRGRAVDLRWPRKRSDILNIVAGILLTRTMATGYLQVELEVTPGNEHIHVGVYPHGEGQDELFVVCKHKEAI